MKKQKLGKSRTLRVPEEIDVFIHSVMMVDPEATYAGVLRRLLRAGQSEIQQRLDMQHGSTQIDMGALR